ncbi:Mitochondrial escape protein 2 [Neolecta irregularis DAH-3]|uniref:Mitochondrial escape protein 2 n=1 Tax=Neolecta irregularis (strain DAH-3) TaxID=1198029 RepID=A0A1U7LGX4_NEOID|nr:Mitochondrial escape protein 2 [Neolecta irregularis DAH-3]|eukprot:OLL21910.1 Mitochondrial escape protein 2 [Neolecta irregularis DAH-3]
MLRQIERVRPPFISTRVRLNGTLSFTSTANTSTIFLDNIYPLRFSFYDVRQLFVNTDYLARQCLPKDLFLEVLKITPLKKDGGAFVELRVPRGMSAGELEQRVQEYLEKQDIRPWFNPLQKIRSFLVEGNPWIEDLHRFERGGVVFGMHSGHSCVEAELFRKYGPLSDIVPGQGFALLYFLRLRSATAAKNCLHGYSTPSARLSIFYAPINRFRSVKDWIFSHPRITIPVAGAVLAAITVAVFDPIREFFVTQKIENTWGKHWDWVKKNTVDLMLNRRHREETFFVERKVDVDKVEGWMNEPLGSFVVIEGPKGSGKRELMNDIIDKRRNTLLIDCQPLHATHSDKSTINILASQTGYFPVFGWLNSISSMVDLATQGLVGEKAGFTETLDTQIRKILNATTNSLAKIALKHKSHPSERPIVIIDNFTSEGVVEKHLATWAAGLVNSGVANVVVLSDVGSEKNLAEALPGKAINTITLSDVDEETAKQYVWRRIGDIKVKGIEKLGGRLTDLDDVVRRINSGIPPDAAVDVVVQNTVTDVLKVYFSAGKEWNKEQAWVLMKLLARGKRVGYYEVLLDSLLDESVLHTLERSEFISISNENGVLG